MRWLPQRSRSRTAGLFLQTHLASKDCLPRHPHQKLPSKSCFTCSPTARRPPRRANRMMPNRALRPREICACLLPMRILPSALNQGGPARSRNGSRTTGRNHRPIMRRGIARKGAQKGALRGGRSAGLAHRFLRRRGMKDRVTTQNARWRRVFRAPHSPRVHPESWARKSGPKPHRPWPKHLKNARPASPRTGNDCPAFPAFEARLPGQAHLLSCSL